MQIMLDGDDLTPVIERIVEQVLARQRADDARLPDDRLCLEEDQAAAMLGVARHVLRDERLRGRVTASVVGRRIVYSRHDLTEYLARRRWRRDSDECGS